MSVIKFTFKAVQSRALANRTFYFIKLFIELCVDVRIRIMCYPAGHARPQMEKKKKDYSFCFTLNVHTLR